MLPVWLRGNVLQVFKPESPDRTGQTGNAARSHPTGTLMVPQVVDIAGATQGGSDVDQGRLPTLYYGCGIGQLC